MAFLSSPGSTNKVDSASIQVSTVNTPISTVSSHDNTANLSDSTVYAFPANQPNRSQLAHEDLKQIHKDDLEEMDLKWQLALLSMRARRTGLGFTSYNAITPPPTGLFAPLTIDLSNSCLEEFQHPKFKGYGPKDSKSVCVDTKRCSTDSGCSRHMIGNISYLTDFKEHDARYVAFGGGAKGGKITGKGTIRTEQCSLSPNFKLADESQVLLKVPRKNNMYSFDIVSQKDLTCLFAKATNDELMILHR
nr:hypothetical protein [Tanacetum cinerariifolium]